MASGGVDASGEALTNKISFIHHVGVETVHEELCQRGISFLTPRQTSCVLNEGVSL